MHRMSDDPVCVCVEEEEMRTSNCDLLRGEAPPDKDRATAQDSLNE